MSSNHDNSEIVASLGETVLVTGAPGFIGARVVGNLLDRGFRSVRCLVRPSSNLSRLRSVIDERNAGERVEIVIGNLLSRESVRSVTEGASVVLHLAAGTGTKSFADAFMNSVVTTRNLLDATLEHGCLKRFVSLSSFAVYSNQPDGRPSILDESSPVEAHPESRAEAYCYGKVRQDDLVMDYGEKHNIPYVILRPGVVYGPGKHSVTGRVGIDTFGFFIHMGGSNRIPFSYVDNCAEAVVLAGLRPGIEGEVFNVLDDDLPTSRQFLRHYKNEVRSFRSIYMPKFASYLFCACWEKYCVWSNGQLPPVFTRREWRVSWKSFKSSNEKLKQELGWRPRVSTQEGMSRFFESCREATKND